MNIAGRIPNSDLGIVAELQQRGNNVAVIAANPSPRPDADEEAEVSLNAAVIIAQKGNCWLIRPSLDAHVQTLEKLKTCKEKVISHLTGEVRRKEEEIFKTTLVGSSLVKEARTLRDQVTVERDARQREKDVLAQDNVGKQQRIQQLEERVRVLEPFEREAPALREQVATLRERSTDLQVENLQLREQSKWLTARANNLEVENKEQSGEIQDLGRAAKNAEELKEDLQRMGARLTDTEAERDELRNHMVVKDREADAEKASKANLAQRMTILKITSIMAILMAALVTHFVTKAYPGYGSHV